MNKNEIHSWGYSNILIKNKIKPKFPRILKISVWRIVSKYFTKLPKSLYTVMAHPGKNTNIKMLLPWEINPNDL